MESIAANYSSSGSESESESERDSEQESALENRSLLPRLPNAIIEKYHIGPDCTMKSVNAGTKFWSTFIYLEWRPSRVERSVLSDMLMEFNSKCQKTNLSVHHDLVFKPLFLSSLGSPLPLHISLSQSITFASEQERDTLHRNLLRNVTESDNCHPFRITFESFYQILASPRSNALFLTLPVSSKLRKKQFSDLCCVIRDSFKETFPKITEKELQDISIKPEFTHMSFAQALNVQKRTMDYLALLQMELPMTNKHATFEFPISSLKFDKNRQVLSIPLKR